MKAHRLLVWFFFLSVTPLTGSSANPPDFQPDPATVQRFGAGYRYPQAGWWVVHIEGEPYERGVQHGRLMSSEIEGYLLAFARDNSDKAPEDAWRLVRMLTDSLFTSRFDREYLEEMRGITDGATAAGATFDNRPLDLTDIVALNIWAEVMTLPWAADAQPTGLEGTKFPDSPARPSMPKKPGHCSAFAAVGPATADGKIVFGHITMFGLHPSTFYNVWLDVKPTSGHRVLMQSFPGGIHSGMDYYMNDAGILCSETTIDQTRLDPAGSPLSSRIRKALQYGDSIDDVVKILQTANNGLYTNEWMLADTKSNEIAMFELGTHTSKLYRSSKNEWPGGTEGFYWGCNNTKDLQVRLETIAATNDRPANMVWNPSDRDQKWIELYRKHKGKIGVDFGKEAFTTSPICASHSVDAKFTTTDMAKELTSWAIFGPPREKTWVATQEEKMKYPGIEPLVSNPWTILHPAPPMDGEDNDSLCPTCEEAVDLKPNRHDAGGDVDDKDGGDHDPTPPAKLVWRGTILPKDDGDIWLASSFADYHRIVAKERGLLALSEKECLCGPDLNRLSINTYASRVNYLGAAVAIGDSPLASIRSDDGSREWYRLASGKGVLVLSELRHHLGDEKFVAALDEFGLANAGKPVGWKQFAESVSKSSGEKLDDFFGYWVTGKGLPTLSLSKVVSSPSGGTNGHTAYRIEGVLAAKDGPLPSRIEITVETEDDEKTQLVAVETNGSFRLDSDDAPQRLIVDKYSRSARTNGGRFDLPYFMHDPEKTIIVVGTADDAAGQRDAGLVLQNHIRAMHINFDLPLVTDTTVTDEQLKNNHILLIGRPATNRITARFTEAFPVRFGQQSFAVDDDLYAHPKSAVMVAGTNPLNPRFSAVVIAGNSALSTYQAADKLGFNDFGVEVKVLPHPGSPKRLVMPAPELIHRFSETDRVSASGTDKD